MVKKEFINLRVDDIIPYDKNPRINDDAVANTIAANGNFFRGYDGLELSDKDYANVSSFPQDYDFGAEHPHYVCGMSVPPNMMANIATEIYAQWFKEK